MMKSLAPAALLLTALAACGGGDTPRGAPLLAEQQTGQGLPPSNPDPATNTYAPALGVTLTQFRKLPSGLYVRDDKVGAGTEARAGTPVQVHYTGWLVNGNKFDASRDHGQTFSFTPGGNMVIQGWDEGVPGMKVGGVRTLVVPPALGYGAAGAGTDIPGNSVLVFRVELVAVQ